MTSWPHPLWLSPPQWPKQQSTPVNNWLHYGFVCACMCQSAYVGAVSSSPNLSGPFPLLYNSVVLAPSPYHSPASCFGVWCALVYDCAFCVSVWCAFVASEYIMLGVYLTQSMLRSLEYSLVTQSLSPTPCECLPTLSADSWLSLLQSLCASSWAWLLSCPMG